MKESKTFQNLVGYTIIIGIIALIVGTILLWENWQKRNPGRYAHLIQPNVLYQVIDIYDGDTIVVHVSDKKVALRLIGMDTPEVVDPRKPVQCYGPEASTKAKELLQGKEIYIEKEASKGNYDMYGRVLAYAFLSDKTLYNKKMIEEGYAREYTFNKENYKYQEEFKNAQALAQKEKRGLWEKCPT